MARNELVRRGALGTVLAAAANVVVTVVALAVLDIPGDFQQLEAVRVALLTVVGGALATLAYGVVQKRSGEPARTYVKVAAAALVLSWVPDVLLVMSDMPGVTNTGVGVLMVMHVVAAVILVAALTRGGFGDQA